MEVSSWSDHTYATTSGNTSLENRIVSTYNPFRYRGYFYDVETQWYYLQSRYYNPNWCRFISLDKYDVITATPMGLTDKNLYAYCDNNPITRIDEDGKLWHVAIGALVGAVTNVAGQVVNDITASILSNELYVSSWET